MHSVISTVRAALLVALGATGGALAWGDEVLPPLPESPVSEELAVAGVAGWGVPLQSDQLETYRGGFDIVKNDMQLSSTVANNSAINVLSGNNSIAEGSFANASGLPMVIQNSGSNVSIQNATIVNVQFTP